MEEKIPLQYRPVRIRDDQLVIIRRLDLNFSEWVRQKLDEEFIDIESLEKKVRKKEEELSKLKEWRDIIKQKESDFKQILDDELDWLIETRKVL